MFLDTSAIIEILLGEPQAGDMLSRLEATSTPKSTGPTVVYEVAVVLASKQNLTVDDAERLVRSLLAELSVDIVTVTNETASTAIDAFSR